MSKWAKMAVFCVFCCLFANTAFSKFLIFGDKFGSGTEVRDFERGLSFETPTSAWNVSVTAKMISLTHAQDYDVYVNLQQSAYRSEFVERMAAMRREDLQDFMPQAVFLIEAQALTLAGTEGILLRYEDNDKKRIFEEIFFLIGKTPYQLSFVAKSGTFYKRLDEFEAILASLKTVPLKAKAQLEPQSEY